MVQIAGINNVGKHHRLYCEAMDTMKDQFDCLFSEILWLE
jgi:hypothetical protein